jgi:hypothetical protein
MRGNLGAAGAAVLAMFLALACWTAVTKAPWCDEGWFASPGWNLAFRGFMGTTVLDPASGTPHLNTRTRLDGIDRYTYWVMPLSLVAQAGWYKLAGFSLIHMRALSIVWAVLALGCWWIVARELTGDRWIALAAVALLSTDYFFVWAAADGRMDMLCSLLGAAALAAYLLLRRHGVGWALFAANGLLAASFLTHPNADLYFLALACIVVIEDRSRLEWRHLMAAGVPYFIAFSAWAPYVLSAPQFFRVQLLGNAAGRDRAFSAPVTSLVREIHRYLDGFGFAPWSHGFAHVSILELAGFVAGIAACVYFRVAAGRTVVRIIGVLCVFLWLFEGLKSSTYLVHVIPWFAMALAIAAVQFRRPIVVGAICLLAASRVAVPALKDKYHRQYLPAAEFVQHAASREDLIMGPAELDFRLGFDRHLVDDIMMGTTTGKQAGFIVIDPRYADYMESIRVSDPQAYQRVSAQLGAQYEKIYDGGEYQVYRQRR